MTSPVTMPVPDRRIAAFAALVVVLSLPLWVIGAATGRQLLPGLPLAALMFFAPGAAAAILVYREAGTTGVRQLLARSFDYERITNRRWYAPMLLTMPAATIMTYVTMRALGLPLVAPQLNVWTVAAMLLVFFVAGVCEELGWSGYVTDLMQARSNALTAAVIIGVVWAVWHWVPLLQAHRPVSWIAWWSVCTIATRVLIVWLYDNTGKSVFAASVFHAMSNVSSIMLSSYWDARITGTILASMAMVVIVAWGPSLLFARRPRSTADPG
jgi:uncharacterized protein